MLRVQTVTSSERVFASITKLQLVPPVRGLERRVRIQNMALKIHFPVPKCLCNNEQKMFSTITLNQIPRPNTIIPESILAPTVEVLEKNFSSKISNFISKTLTELYSQDLRLITRKLFRFFPTI